ncbi:MAG TPA: hypothetical protein VN739_01610 [Nitrososphaerales archaeon]|nr:hypothetical protein [Nitrososphaerales archaeon]
MGAPRMSTTRNKDRFLGLDIDALIILTIIFLIVVLFVGVAFGSLSVVFVTTAIMFAITILFIARQFRFS